MDAGKDSSKPRTPLRRLAKNASPGAVDLTTTTQSEKRSVVASPSKKPKISQTIILLGDDDDDDDVVEVVNVSNVASAAATPTRTSSMAKSCLLSQSNDHALAVALAAGVSQDFSSSHKKRKKSHHFSCGICLDDEVPSCHGYNLDGCRHRFCLSCLRELIQTSMQSKSTDVHCPHDKCHSTLNLMDIRFILRDRPWEFEEYANLAAMSRLEEEAADEGSDTRRCPAERCNYMFVFVPGAGTEGRLFTCPQCTASFCLQCGANDQKVGPAHPGKSCFDRKEQLQQEAEERRKFEAWQKENSEADAKFNELMEKEGKAGRTLPCPNCKAPITKNGGCHHMHCSKCKTNFNWSGK